VQSDSCSAVPLAVPPPTRSRQRPPVPPIGPVASGVPSGTASDARRPSQTTDWLSVLATLSPSMPRWYTAFVLLCVPPAGPWVVATCWYPRHSAHDRKASCEVSLKSCAHIDGSVAPELSYVYFHPSSGDPPTRSCSVTVSTTYLWNQPQPAGACC